MEGLLYLVSSFFYLIAISAFAGLVLVPLGLFVWVGLGPDVTLLRYSTLTTCVLVVLFYSSHFLIFIVFSRWRPAYTTTMLILLWLLAFGGLVRSILLVNDQFMAAQQENRSVAR